MLVDIPKYKTLDLHTLVLDYNGTVALDGRFKEELTWQLEDLALSLKLYVLTADTFGTVAEELSGLPVTLHILQSQDHTAEKAAVVERLGAEGVIAIGNGNNDAAMLERAGLGIAVLGEEGLSIRALNAADLLVPDIARALELLQQPKRLIATLRR
ncbi:HAD family hydrolase [Nitratifractor salsuginis]|uniref:Haloacid dehalogenase domain protein hydrolase n=1 Tax=Nitratifractor salsuginis (strain DSM 16511 / JCM 12458 / E9I37-1) TaxID=749222 RepID=E6WY15_NITSE|nr:HAD hydrolase family protein [Nitratifractor salsuginis]ADV46389.1 Haloacid dehalogenase domain protein hydrolase [Nitratifractor salsuginis DSM 16511]